MIAKNALDLIGNTPLVALDKISGGKGKLYAKAEFVQPGGSIKDRAALHIIKDAYESGRLKAGQPVVEMTSGNMGAGLAVVCNVFGNSFIAVMSAGNSPARAVMLESLGAKVVLTKQVDGAPGQVTGKDIHAATQEAIHLSEINYAFYVDQFHNPSSVSAHYKSTGPEIWNDLGDELDVFVAAIGSGGTFIGTSKYLKEQNPEIICAVVEPKGAEVLAGKPMVNPKHNMQGIGYGLIVPHWNPDLPDLFLSVTSEEASYYRKILAEKEGLYVGYSAAANVCASVKLIESGFLQKSPVIVTVLCDTGLKY